MQPYRIDPKLATRWINFENPAGAPGMGGRAASPLGIGRKGAPARVLALDETAQLCDVEGPGTVRDFWCTTTLTPVVLRSLVLRGWFDEQEHPSIECPLGDFMGFAHGQATPGTTVAHSFGAPGALHCFLPMPFRTRARLTLTNESNEPVPFTFQIAVTLGDAHEPEVGRLHACFRRENPTTMGRDFELLPLRTGRGRWLGSVVGVRALHDFPWSEGEVKVYLDGDEAFPTLCGTGSDDWERRQQGRFHSMHRWHLADPVVWHKEARITIQQIGRREGKLVETFDDWSCATFWYEPLPSRRLALFPTWEERTADLWQEDVRGKDRPGGTNDERAREAGA